MKFKEALKAAKLPNPGRTTWHGKASDGTAVFTIWADDIHRVDGRFFAWWDHPGEPGLHQEPSARQKSRARAFVKRAAANIGKSCRAVIIHPSCPKSEGRRAGSAEYPHSKWARAEIRAADVDAIQFIIELLPPA
jgi:hypothetical protein